LKIWHVVVNEADEQVKQATNIVIRSIRGRGLPRSKTKKLLNPCHTGTHKTLPMPPFQSKDTSMERVDEERSQTDLINFHFHTPVELKFAFWGKGWVRPTWGDCGLELQRGFFYLRLGVPSYEVQKPRLSAHSSEPIGKKASVGARRVDMREFFLISCLQPLAQSPQLYLPCLFFPELRR
jgi:hypothetical protein